MIKKMATVVAVLLVFLLGCALPMHEMREAFQESLKNTMGRTLESLKHEPGRAFIGNRDPSEVRNLENGNVLQVYRDYWGQIGITREICTVFLEFDAETMVVVNASADGSGCYRAY